MFWGVWYTVRHVFSRPFQWYIRASKNLKCQLVSQEKQICNCLATTSMVVKRTAMEKRLRLFFAMFSTSDSFEVDKNTTHFIGLHVTSYGNLYTLISAYFLNWRTSITIPFLESVVVNDGFPFSLDVRLCWIYVLFKV